MWYHKQLTLQETCPFCRAAPGEPCTVTFGRQVGAKASELHADRRWVADNAPTGTAPVVLSDEDAAILLGRLVRTSPLRDQLREPLLAWLSAQGFAHGYDKVPTEQCV